MLLNEKSHAIGQAIPNYELLGPHAIIASCLWDLQLWGAAVSHTTPVA